MGGSWETRQRVADTQLMFNATFDNGAQSGLPPSAADTGYDLGAFDTAGTRDNPVNVLQREMHSLHQQLERHDESS